MAAAAAAKNVLVLGGSGFVGRSICARLVSSNNIDNVRVISRDAGKAARVLPREVEVIEGDVLDPTTRDALLSNNTSSNTAVVNCIGLLYETKSKGATFDNAHVGLAETLVKHAPKSLVYISALGVDNNINNSKSISAYARSKKAAEDIYATKLPADSSVRILRPSIIYGASDTFFNRFNSMATYSPFLPLVGGGATKYQPVHVDDVARAVELVLNNSKSSIYELGGSDVLTFKQLMEMTMRVSGKRRALLNIPFCLADIQGYAMEKIHAVVPSFPPLITRDQVKLLRCDNVVGKNSMGFRELGIEDVRGCSDDDIAYIKKK